RLGVDVGGTFTDLVLVGPDGQALTHKVLSTTANYAEGIVAGVRALLAEAGVAPAAVGDVVHGTTVATNAILEHRGARTGLITTAGFRDILEIRRLRMPRLYDMDFERPAPLVRRRWRREVGERMNHRGEIVQPLDRAGAAAAVDRLIAEGVESIAVCLLHAYANPAHERALGALVRERAPGVSLTLSSDILPEIREFERTSTAVANAYVMPIMDRYLERLASDLTTLGVDGALLVMQSNGGIMTADGARRRPVHVIESGPAAGVIATAALARRTGLSNVISIDMGGTTAKASIIEGGEIKRTGEYEIGGSVSQGSRLNKGGGYLLRVPAIDIAEVGAGGGSLVSLDPAGALRVGPESAGALPGPVCYDLGGTQVTLTDANVCLGYLHPERLASGLPLRAGPARSALAAQIAAPLGLPLLEAAHGVYLLGCAGMARAVRAVTIERGRDPRDFTIVAFGGNGPLFAAEMARSLEIGRVLVPPAPGVFSAIGLLEADVEHHLVRTYLRPLAAVKPGELAAALADLEEEAETLVRAEGFRGPVETARAADLKYQGQSFELTVPLPDEWTVDDVPRRLAAAFGREHERTYGHKADDDPIQIVNLRLTVRLPRPAERPTLRAAGRAPASRETRPAYFGPADGSRPTPVIGRLDLAGAGRPGPLLIEEYDATTLVPPDATAELDAWGNIVITTGA
ncbi:MAG TPA: hydantoinase/oxoprolinase family protein, partial [Methylomirabilota bacterium]|nr:hydantoinase/oxoprolinase family protein [Methylomirabilota bacterium]